MDEEDSFPDVELTSKSAAQVLEEYGSGERDFHYHDLRDQDFSNSDLRAASFYGSDLRGSNFSNCQLTHVQFKSCDLTGATLGGSAINASDLIGTNFHSADLSQTDLTGAALCRADLSSANLSGAFFNNWQLSDSNLAQANLDDCKLSHVQFVDQDVSAFCDNETIEHSAPSSIDHRTVVKSYRNPSLRQFMIDCGVHEIFTEFMIECAEAIDSDVLWSLMQSTFISYGHPDEAFARKLYFALRKRGVAAFFFPESARYGERIGDEVHRGINEHDRFILICSKQSLTRNGVLNEIRETLDREARDGGAKYLLPITIDDYLFDEWPEIEPDLARRVSSRVVGDFRDATSDDEKFDMGIDRLMSVLKKKQPKPSSAH